MSRRACLSVRGTEAEGFLQNLVTCDVAGLSVGELTFGALLTPQGKILFDFFVLREADGFLLETLASFRDDLIKRLTFYKLRAAVEIASDPREVRVGESGLRDPRDHQLPRRSYGTDGEQIGPSYDAMRIARLVPEAGMDFAYGEAFPHDVALDRMSRPGAGVDFSKGCYVGQEVVSRMQHRGTARRRPVRIELTGPAERGDEVHANGRTIGSLGTVAGSQALAIVRLDRAEKAREVAVGSHPVRWASDTGGR